MPPPRCRAQEGRGRGQGPKQTHLSSVWVAPRHVYYHKPLFRKIPGFRPQAWEAARWAACEALGAGLCPPSSRGSLPGEGPSSGRCRIQTCCGGMGGPFLRKGPFVGEQRATHWPPIGLAPSPTVWVPAARRPSPARGPSLCIGSDQVSVPPPGGPAWLRGVGAAEAGSAALPMAVRAWPPRLWRGRARLPALVSRSQGPLFSFCSPHPGPQAHPRPPVLLFRGQESLLGGGGWTAGEAGQDGSGLGAGVKLSGPRWLQVWWVGCQAEGWGLPASALLQGSSEEASTSGHSRRASQRVPGRLRDVGSFWSEKKRPSVKGRRFFLVVTLA